MKKGGYIALGVLGAVLLAAIVLQVKIIPLESGGKAVVYVPPFGSRPGGSACADLTEALAQRYGQEGEAVEQLASTWRGEAAVIRDTSAYETEYLGRAFAGGDYVRCTVTTVRTVVSPDGGETLAATTRTCTYTGYDDGRAGSRERARVLWGTLEEEYADGEAYFNGEPETAP